MSFIVSNAFAFLDKLIGVRAEDDLAVKAYDDCMDFTEVLVTRRGHPVMFLKAKHGMLWLKHPEIPRYPLDHPKALTLGVAGATPMEYDNFIALPYDVQRDIAILIDHYLKNNIQVTNTTVNVKDVL